MRYERVHVESIGIELAPVVVTTDELEDRLAPVFEALRVRPGQVEALTGIVERRWWEPGAALSTGAIAAARDALGRSNVRPADLGVLIYAGVCREGFEPATATAVAAGLGVGPAAAVFDVGNACLGVLNGIVDVANRIELGQVRAGLVTSCESAREINDAMIDRMLADRTMPLFTRALATLTGGSGAAAVLVTDGSFGPTRARLEGGACRTAPEHHRLCRWGLEENGHPGSYVQTMSTDSVAVLEHGVALGRATWQALLDEMGWAPGDVDRVVCHQVGKGHRDEILRTLGVSPARDYSTFAHLGNIGTVSVPLTAALADRKGVLSAGDRVALLGIGSGLNCMMLATRWH